MNTQEFLSLVLPSTGLYLAQEVRSYRDRDGNDKLARGHYAFVNHSEMATAIVNRSQATTNPIYYALGGYHNIDTAALQRSPGMKGTRTQANVHSLRSFWLDIDVRDDGKSYPTHGSAAAAVKKFCAQHGLPMPLAVDSGYGLHLYWPLSADVPADQWKHYALMLKELCNVSQLLADPSRTSDEASVLRPVGTMNHKHGAAKPVRALNCVAPYDPQDIMARLARATELLGVQVAPAARKPLVQIAGTMPANMVTQAGSLAMQREAAFAETMRKHYDSHAPRVALGCRQLAWHRDTNGAEATEPQWYDMIGVMQFCVGGEEFIHAASAGHPGYSQEATDAKIIAHRNSQVGPTTCEYIESRRPGGCAGCPHRGKVKSPILLGRVTESAPSPVVEVVDATGEQHLVIMPDPPKPFRRVIRDGAVSVVMDVELSKDGGVSEVEVLYHDFVPVRRIYDVKHQKFSLVMRAELPHDGTRDIVIDGGMLASDKKATYNKLGNEGIACSLENVEHLRVYMLGYMQELAKAAKADTVHAQCGFDDAHSLFVLPNKVVTATEVKPVLASPNVTYALKRWEEPCGTLEGWVNAVKLLDKPGLEAMRTGVLVGFASPIFHLTGYNGGQVNIFGPPGTGKSLALKAMCSIWSHPTATWVSVRDSDSGAVGDTPKAFYNKLGVLHHVAAAFDEATNVSAGLLGSIVYELTTGQGRSRLDTTGDARESCNDFALLLLSTSNDSMQSKHTLDSDTSVAQAIRCFEMRHGECLTKPEGAEIAYALEDNYGHAGVPYIQRVLRDVPKVQQRLREWITYFDEHAHVTSRDRFWSAYAASMIVGLEIAREVGLLSFSVADMADYFVKTILTMRANMTEQAVSHESVIDEFLRSHLHNTLVVSTSHNPPLVKLRPAQNLAIRVDIHLGRVWIEAKFLRLWLQKRGMSIDDLRRTLKQDGTLVSASEKAYLGKGVHEMTTLQTRCLVINLPRETLASATDNVVPIRTA